MRIGFNLTSIIIFFLFKLLSHVYLLCFLTPPQSEANLWLQWPI